MEMKMGQIMYKLDNDNFQQGFCVCVAIMYAKRKDLLVD